MPAAFASLLWLAAAPAVTPVGWSGIPHSAFRIPHSASAAAKQDKKLVLRYYGQSFFQVETTTGQKVVFDPHGIVAFRPLGAPPALVDANVVLTSHDHADHTQLDAVKDVKAARVFQGVTTSKDGRQSDWNKVNEKVLETKLRTVGTFHDPVGGMQRGKNTVWVVEANGVVFCHLGDLGHELTDDQVKAIVGTTGIDVLMVPVGGIFTLNGDQAKKVTAQLKPRRFVLPMHYGIPNFDEILGPDEFLDGRPKDSVRKELKTNELEIPLDQKAPDAPTVVLLSWLPPVAPPKK